MFDSQYMLKTHQHVSYVFEMYVWCHCVLQIMRYVRTLKLQDGYDPNTTHIVYGQVGGSDATDAAAAEQQQPGDVFAAPVWVYLCGYTCVGIPIGMVQLSLFKLWHMQCSREQEAHGGQAEQPC
jgi:hypothetical protein